jgi:hypothetical protein
MACLAVWIRILALRSGVFRNGEAVRSYRRDGIQRLQLTLLARISVVISVCKLGGKFRHLPQQMAKTIEIERIKMA